jgi:hypothetical protein
MLQLNGKTLQYDKAFVHDGMQYPSNWLRLTSLEEKQAIGIVEVSETPVASWDQRFYWGVDNPKDLDQLKETWKAQQSEYASATLGQSDWRVIKARETGGQVPIVWFNYRRDVRTTCNTRQAEIDACEDVAALVELLYGSEQIESTDDDGNTVMIDNPNLATEWPTSP